eukprot:scaffold6966_cov112-Cylindrotheca_fusiformis.AAC.15
MVIVLGSRQPKHTAAGKDRESVPVPQGHNLFWKRNAPFLLLTLFGIVTLEWMAPPTSCDVSQSKLYSVSTKNQNNRAVVIVGAGMAGLAAAKELAKHGVDYLMLEASDRIGGRIEQSDNFTDFPIDLGTSLMNDPNLLQKIAESDDIPDMKVKSVGKGSGQYIPTRTWYEFLNAYILPNQKQIDYNCKVDRIDHGGPRTAPIELHCGRRTYLADTVIVTVPLPLLQSSEITYSPPLPGLPDVNAGEVWPGIKVIFEFKDSFYPEYFSIDDPAKSDPGKVEFWNCARLYLHSTQHVLAGHYVGQPALKYVNLDDETIAKSVLTRLDQKFGNGVATKKHIRHMIVNWSRRPLARGAFSYHGTEKWTSNQKMTERLYLAGEAFPTNESQEAGSIQTAALSGRHAAKELIMYLNSTLGEE